MFRLAATALVFWIGMVVLARAQAPQPTMPDPYKLNMLIRTSIIALNHANKTGNYTVLRDLAAPIFQQTNNAARLAEIFANLRKRRLDLSPIMFFQPKLVRQPVIDKRGLLRLTGFFETRPEQISFDMLFQFVGKEWRLFGIAIDVAPPKAAKTTSPAPAAPALKAKPKRDTTKETRSVVKPSAGTDRAPARVSVDVPLPGRKPASSPAPAPEPAEAEAKQPAETSDTAEAKPKEKKPPESAFWPF